MPTETLATPKVLKPALPPRDLSEPPAEARADAEPAPRDGEPSQAVIPVAVAAQERLVSLDAYRGFVMVLMVSAGLGIPAVVRSFDRSPAWAHYKTPLWERLAFHTDHVAWVGCSLWDLIQPSFMFMVGAALPFSIAARQAKGQSFSRMLFHAVVRSLVLVLLGIFLISNWGRGTDWTFTNVLTQIGLGYPLLFLVAWLRPRWQVVVAFAILAVYWAAFALYPAPPMDPDPTKVGLPADWQRLVGLPSHWEKHTNLAARVDKWFLNLFPRADGKPFETNNGGYTTLNFVPSLATMIFGLLAGELVRSRLRPLMKCALLLAAGAAGLAVGWGLGWADVCPVVKRIWTPSWAVYSAGWAFGLLALFYLVLDVAKLRAWALPLVVVGMNSIAVYCMSMLLKPWVRGTLKRHAGEDVYEVFGAVWAPMVEASVFLLFCWGVAWWMYRKKIFLRI